MKLFYEAELSGVLEERRRNLRQEIDSQNRNYILNVNDSQLIAHLIDKYRIDPLVLHEDGIRVTDGEVVIRGEQHDEHRFNMSSGEEDRRQAITFHLPFSGSQDLLKWRPSTRLLWTEDVMVQEGEIRFKAVVWRDGAVEAVRREWDVFLQSLRTQVGYSTSDVNGYNDSLEAIATQALQSRKADILKKQGMLASLGIPLKQSNDVSSTFAVPPPKRRVLVAKPNASADSFVPEPALDEATYDGILRIIHDTGVEIERHPSIYEGKDEETLRDHLLMVLSPHFQSVSGETFNRSGKTDILIRHDGKNVFVAECGIWKGAKQCLSKIDQLLSYLTWRDSKTALILFVRNKEFGAVLETVGTTVRTHACFVKETARRDEAWLRYEFTLKDDPSRAVRLAVLCFHFP